MSGGIKEMQCACFPAVLMFSTGLCRGAITLALAFHSFWDEQVGAQEAGGLIGEMGSCQCWPLSFGEYTSTATAHLPMPRLLQHPGSALHVILLQKTDEDLRAVVAASVAVVALLTVGCGAVTVPLLAKLLAGTGGSDVQEPLLPCSQEGKDNDDSKQPPPKSLIHKWWRAVDAAWLQPVLGGRSVRGSRQGGAQPQHAPDNSGSSSP
jgi:hypothetical protein